jgi:hypothetical protein
MTGQVGRSVPGGPDETRRQAADDVAEVYARYPISVRPWRALLGDACKQADVSLGRFDSQIMAWLADWEPETCAVIACLISRAYAAGLAEGAPLSR